MILNTLPISHYVDKVRWCMDKAKIPYEEEKDIGIFWVFTTGRLVPNLNIPAKNISISNSSDILKYLYAHLKCSDEEGAKFLEPTPKSFELEKKIDECGRHIRTYIYYHVSNTEGGIIAESFYFASNLYNKGAKSLLSIFS